MLGAVQGRWRLVRGLLGSAPTMLEMKASWVFFSLIAKKVVALFFFPICLSFYQKCCPSASEHLYPPQPVCYSGGELIELKFFRDLLLLLWGFL